MVGGDGGGQVGGQSGRQAGARQVRLPQKRKLSPARANIMHEILAQPHDATLSHKICLPGRLQLAPANTFPTIIWGQLVHLLIGRSAFVIRLIG